MQICVNQISFLKAVSSFRDARECGSILTASIVTLFVEVESRPAWAT